MVPNKEIVKGNEPLPLDWPMIFHLKYPSIVFSKELLPVSYTHLDVYKRQKENSDYG